MKNNLALLNVSFVILTFAQDGFARTADGKNSRQTASVSNAHVKDGSFSFFSCKGVDAEGKIMVSSQRILARDAGEAVGLYNLKMMNTRSLGGPIKMDGEGIRNPVDDIVCDLLGEAK